MVVIRALVQMFFLPSSDSALLLLVSTSNSFLAFERFGMTFTSALFDITGFESLGSAQGYGVMQLNDEEGRNASK